MSRLLLTGATGFLGGAVAAALARENRLPQVDFLVRAATPAAGLERLKASLALHAVPPADLAALHEDQIAPGDLTEPARMAEAGRRPGLSAVIHCAALATFSRNPQVWAANVEGTLALAQAAHAQGTLRRWVQVGTAMSCGPGLPSPVQESWAHGSDDLAGHLVPYTHSKLAAERRLRAIDGLPLVAARPSIIVGDSQLGCAPSPSIFWVFRMAHALQRFTVRLDQRIDTIPVDWCAEALLRLADAPRLEHDLFHVSAGTASAQDFATLEPALAQALGQPSILADYRAVPRERLRELVPLFEAKLGRVNRLLILQALALYGAFAELDYVFDNQRLLAATGLPPPPPLTAYLERCVTTTAHLSLAEQMRYDFK